MKTEIHGFNLDFPGNIGVDIGQGNDHSVINVMYVNNFNEIIAREIKWRLPRKLKKRMLKAGITYRNKTQKNDYRISNLLLDSDVFDSEGLLRLEKRRDSIQECVSKFKEMLTQGLLIIPSNNG